MEKFLHIYRNNHEAHAPATTAVLLYGFVELIHWEFPNLAGPFWRWYCNDDPGAFVVLNGRRHALTPGRVFLIPPHTAFSSGVRKSVRHTYIHFTTSLGHMTAPGVLFSHRPGKWEETLRRRLVRSLRKSAPKSEIEAAFTAHALVNLALAAVPGNYWNARAPDSRVDRLVRHIHDHFPAAVKNADLARLAGMNVNAFTRFFRQRTGRTPHQFLLNLRIERACGLLQQSKASLDEIAERTGFCDRFHFSRAFKAQLGVSPARFRRLPSTLNPHPPG